MVRRPQRHSRAVPVSHLCGILLLGLISCTTATIDARDTRSVHGEQEMSPSLEGKETGPESLDVIFNGSKPDVVVEPPPASQGYLRRLSQHLDVDKRADYVKNAKSQLSKSIMPLLETSSRTISELSSWAARSSSDILDYISSVSASVMISSRAVIGRIAGSTELAATSIEKPSSVLFQHGKKAVFDMKDVLAKKMSNIRSHPPAGKKASKRLGATGANNPTLKMRERRESAVSGGDLSIEQIETNEHVTDAGGRSFNGMLIVIAFACISFLTMSFIAARRSLSTEETSRSDNSDSSTPNEDGDEETLVFEEAAKFVAECCFADELEEIDESNNDTDVPSEPMAPEVSIIEDDLLRSMKIFLGREENEDEDSAQHDSSLKPKAHEVDIIENDSQQVNNMEDRAQYDVTLELGGGGSRKDADVSLADLPKENEEDSAQYDVAMEPSGEHDSKEKEEEERPQHDISVELGGEDSYGEINRKIESDHSRSKDSWCSLSSQSSNDSLPSHQKQSKRDKVENAVNSKRNHHAGKTYNSIPVRQNYASQTDNLQRRSHNGCSRTIPEGTHSIKPTSHKRKKSKSIIKLLFLIVPALVAVYATNMLVRYHISQEHFQMPSHGNVWMGTRKIDEL